MESSDATVAAGFLGRMLDAFDFFLVVMTLTAALVFIVCAVVATLGPERRGVRAGAVLALTPCPPLPVLED